MNRARMRDRPPSVPADAAGLKCGPGWPMRNVAMPGPQQGETSLIQATGELFDEMNTYGAVLAGRRTAEQIDHWGGDRHGVPIFVVSHRPPGPSVADYPLVRYVTDGIASAMAQAKAAAGDR